MTCENDVKNVQKYYLLSYNGATTKASNESINCFTGSFLCDAMDARSKLETIR